ncbi:MAG: hypothetical protein ACLP01_26305 [Solirubrobacteraceae bacterium]
MPTIHSPSRGMSLRHRLTASIRALRSLALLGAAGALGALACAGFTTASASAVTFPAPVGCASVPNQSSFFECYQSSYQSRTLDDPADPTFNQLLGINTAGVIAGYFGSGVPVGNQGHPNQGYLLFPPYYENYYASNNYPGSLQTQVTGINDNGILVGFDSTMNNAGNMNNDNHGWYKAHGQFFQADFPTGAPAVPPVDQLLGVNDSDIAVGFYTDASGNNHGYAYNIHTDQARALNNPTGFTNVTAAAINNRDDIAGFGTATGGTTDGFFEPDALGGASTVFTLAFPGATSTNALGVNDADEVVGVYTDANGGLHGFTWYPRTGFTTINSPFVNPGTTTINGVDDCGDLVGFYVDGAGNTDGLLMSPNFNRNQFTTIATHGLRSADQRDGARIARIKINTKKLHFNLAAAC